MRIRVVLVLVLVLAARAHADTVTVGLFAPTAPFPSTSARVELATRLGEAVGKALGATGSGKVFARGADFATAVRKGEVAVASPPRTAEATAAWQLVARGTDKLAQLKGKRVLVPGIGGRETDFVLNVLLEGEVPKDFFAKIETAPDTVSALAALGLGKADAAVVPAGVEIPAGVSVVARLPALSGPVLVTYGSVTPDKRQALAAAITSFKGDATVSGFKAADADAVKQIARRFTVPAKRGPLAVPAIRLLVGDLVEGRKLSIERTPVTAFAAKPH